jgi:hypothetical protein
MNNLIGNIKMISIALVTLSLLAFGLSSNAASSGDLIKCPDFTAVYFLAEDGNRYVFPNSNTYFTWYKGFDDVVEITCNELSDYALGGNITYKPGSRLLKLVSARDVYAVESGGILRAIQSEEQAVDLYGSDWAAQVDDLSDAFWSSYTLGDPLADGENPESETLGLRPIDEKIVLDPVESDFEPAVGIAEGPSERGPWSNRIMSARSTNGLTWTKTNQVISDQADVPDLAILNGRLYLYYTGWTVGDQSNKTAVAISDDDGETWAFKYIEIPDFDGSIGAVDPDIQILDDGTFRLYVTSDEQGSQKNAGTFYTESTDGINFIGRTEAFRRDEDNALDPNTILIEQTWHYFAGGAPGGNWHATSSDGKTFDFYETNDFKVNDNTYMMTNGIQFADGTYRYYAFANHEPDTVSFITEDGYDWEYEGVALELDESAGYEYEHVKDATVIELDDGTYLMVYVTRIPQ